MTPPRRVLLAVVSLVTLFAAGRLLVLYFDFARGSSGVSAYHIESTALAFVLLGVGSFLLRPDQRSVGSRDEVGVEGISSTGMLLGFVGLAVALYWPILGTGLLSDDFVLLGHADAGNLGAVSDVFFRPLVLLVWAVMRAVGLSDLWFHALNVALHGLVAYLTARVVGGWSPSHWIGLVSGLMVLAMPTAVEPVAWISGGFDLVAVTLMLTGVLIARQPPTLRTNLLLWLTCAAALLSKETGVVTVPLILVDSAIRRAWPVAARRHLAGIAAVAVAYSLVRLVLVDSSYFNLSKYTVQRVLFQTSGGLAHPWPMDARGSIASLVAAAAIVILATLFMFDGAKRDGRIVAGSASWVLIAAAPVMTMLFIGPNLEASRYLYGSSPAWAGLVVILAFGLQNRVARTAGILSLGILMAMNAWASRQQMTSWQKAASLRDAIILQLTDAAGIRDCRHIEVMDLPDNVAGAYVFRNGSLEAFRAAGLPPVGDSSKGCRFRWSLERQVLIPE